MLMIEEISALDIHGCRDLLRRLNWLLASSVRCIPDSKPRIGEKENRPLPTPT